MDNALQQKQYNTNHIIIAKVNLTIILLKYPNAPARFVNKIEDCFRTMKTDLASYTPLLVIAPTGQFT